VKWFLDWLDRRAYDLNLWLANRRKAELERKKAIQESLILPKPPRGWKPGDSHLSDDDLQAAKTLKSALEQSSNSSIVDANSRRELKEKAPVAPVNLLERAFSFVKRPVRDPNTPPPVPKRIPVFIREPRQYTPRELLTRNIMIVASVVIFGFFANLLVLGHLQHQVHQQQLSNEFREQLALATAPVSEGDENLILLPNGAPVALLEIPALGIKEVVVEGTDSGTLKMGPGHRRDTVLPGQAGISVIMARAAAYGGPFGNIQSLQPGTEFSVITGQGYHVYSVIGVRYAGDPGPAEPAEGIGRLVLETARGSAYMPGGILRVDAQLVSTSPNLPGEAFPELASKINAESTAGEDSAASELTSSKVVMAGSAAPTTSPGASSSPTPKSPTPSTTPIPGGTDQVPTTRNVTITLASVKALDPGPRFTGTNTLPLAERELATDTSTVWALVFALQFLIAVEIAAIWAYRKVGLEKTWIVFIPVLALTGLIVSDQLIRLLPNLL
jgi:sortase (surface protein transpeptidase)